MKINLPKWFALRWAWASLAIAIIVGCTPLTSTEEQKAGTERASDLAPPKPQEPPKEAPLPSLHELDPSKHVIPDTPVAGMLAGDVFRPTVTLKLGEWKTLKFFHHLYPNQGWPYQPCVDLTIIGAVADRKIVVPRDDSTKAKTNKLPAGYPFEVMSSVFTPATGALGNGPGGFALTLEFGSQQGDTIPGRVHYSHGAVTGHPGVKIWFAGTFTAKIVKD